MIKKNKQTLKAKNSSPFPSYPCHTSCSCQMSMSVKSLYSTSVLLTLSATTLWAHTTAPADQDTLMLTQATLEQTVQVGVCGWVV